MFFTNPSLEQVFKEAIANSLDANATSVEVKIFIDSFEKQETLQLTVTDNGEGFTDKRYDKFCELLKVEEDTHKGVGRLVYLSYFDTINPHGAGYQIDKIFPNSKNVYATALECRKLAVYQMDRFHRVLRKLGINQKSYLSQTKTYHSTGYDPEMAELSGDHYVEGYFQSERYFREIADQLRRELTFTEKIPEVVHLVEQKIHDSDCVSIHIRRGDYAAGGQSTTADTYYLKLPTPKRCAEP